MRRREVHIGVSQQRLLDPEVRKSRSQDGTGWGGIAELLAQGRTNREIGEQLNLAEKTVKHYMTNVLQKLHVRSLVEAALLAQRRELEGG